MKLFVHKYKHTHEHKRKQLRRACKDGLVRLLEKTADGFLYEVPLSFKVTNK